METVYLETTVIGHLAGRFHPDAMIRPRQEFIRRWWPELCSKYKVFVSELVADECSAGDPTAAQERLDIIQNIDIVDTDDDVRRLATALLAARAIPPSEPRDAFHVALAAVNGIEYLLTWNFVHIANATAHTRIEAVCREGGYEPPIICSPEQLAGEEDNEITDG